MKMLREQVTAAEIGGLCGKSESAVKFHAAKMMLEILMGRMLSKEESQKLRNRMKGWNP